MATGQTDRYAISSAVHIMAVSVYSPINML